MFVALLGAACGEGAGNQPLPVAEGTRNRNNPRGDAGTVGDAAVEEGERPDCSGAPQIPTGEGAYCLGVPDAGPDGRAGPKTCNAEANEICCGGGRLGGGGFESSRCQQASVSGAGGFQENACTGFSTTPQQWHCMEAEHCPGSDEVCCLIAGDAGSPTPGEDKLDGAVRYPGCGIYFQNQNFIGGTRCRKAQCRDGELTMCATDDDCPGGRCVYVSTAGRSAGYCRR